MQTPYIEGKDHYAEFANEFKTEEIEIGGETIKIWEDFDDGVRDKWIERWVECKKDAEQSTSVFDGEVLFTKYYPDWYKHKYLPHIQDYKRFLEGSSSTKMPDFWLWYLNVYLRGDKYPLF